jgi:hypothetical protein
MKLALDMRLFERQDRLYLVVLKQRGRWCDGNGRGSEAGSKESEAKEWSLRISSHDPSSYRTYIRRWLAASLTRPGSRERLWPRSYGGEPAK